MEASINLVNSSELNLTEEELLLRGIPASINLGTLSEDALRLLVFYLAKQGPYELASTSGFFKGSLSQWLESLKANLTLKASVKYYNDALKIKGLQEGDLIYVSETDLVYLYDGKKIPAKKDGIKLSGLSTYQIAVKNGYLGSEEEWIEDSKGKPLKFEELTEEQKKELTGIGKSAYDLSKELGFEGSLEEWLSTLKGEKGDKGEEGSQGLSAYQVAVSKGFKGTPEQWLQSLVGKDGKQGHSAYESYLALGYKDSLEDWLKSLQGNSAYDLAVEEGFKGTKEEWFATLKGTSAYQSALNNGYKGDEISWLNTLKGTSAYQTAVLNGFKGTEEEWLSSLKGKSAYDLALETGFVGDMSYWLESLKGDTGKSAYDLDVENGFEGTLEEWLSLKNDVLEKTKIAREHALQAISSATLSEDALEEVLLLKENIHKHYLDLFKAKADSEVNVAKVEATLLLIEEYVIRIQKALVKISQDVSKNSSYSLTASSSAQTSKEALYSVKEHSDNVQKILLESYQIRDQIYSFLKEVKASSASVSTIQKEIKDISLKIENQLLSFEVLKEELKTFYKEDSYVLTESGLSLRDYLVFLNKSISKRNLEFEQQINQRVQSVNGKEGAHVTITREDLGIPSDKQLLEQKKEDRFVILSNGQSLSEYIKNNITDPVYFGAIAYDKYATSNVSSDDAFKLLEDSYKDKKINLNGKYYTLSYQPNNNKYYNGYFIINDLVQKQELIMSTDMLWNKGCGEGFCYAELQARDVHRSAGFLQSLAYDYFTDSYWVLSNYKDEATNNEYGIIQRYRQESKTTTYADVVSIKSEIIGHQGLGVQHINGNTKLWVGSHPKSGKAGTHILRCDPPVKGGDVTNVEYFKLFDFSEGNLNTTYHLTPSVSPYENLLCCANIDYTRQQYLIKIFDLSLLTDTNVDYTYKYLSKFYLTNKHDGTSLPLQSVVTDGKLVYCLLGLYTIQVYTLEGKLVDIIDQRTGYERSRNLIDANGTSISLKVYEPESLTFVPTNSGFTLGVLTAMGYSGAWSLETDIRRNYIYTSIPNFSVMNNGSYSATRPTVISNQTVDISVPSSKGFEVACQSNDTPVGQYNTMMHVNTNNLHLKNVVASDTSGDKVGVYLRWTTTLNRQLATISTSNREAEGGATISLYDNDDTIVGGNLVLYAGKVNDVQYSLTIQPDGVISPTNNMQLGTTARRFKGYFNDLSLTSTQVYADNASAKAGGLLAGQIYRTATGQLMVVF